MITFTLRHIGRYTAPETIHQAINCPWLVLYIKGTGHNRLYGPNGTLLNEQHNGAPYLRFGLPGMVTDFKAGPDRENWVIMFDDLPLRYAAADDTMLELWDEDTWIPVPLVLPLTMDEAIRWRTVCSTAQALLQTPLPANRLQAKMEIMRLFHVILSRSGGMTTGASPAAVLKRLIDEDTAFRRSLAELGDETPYSSDHLRLLFEREFGIRPKQYRHRRQMAQVMDLVSGSSLNVKEIALRTGFRHTSHLCQAFKKEFGMSPGEGIRKYRY